MRSISGNRTPTDIGEVLFRAVLVDALHAALEDREIAFDGVRAGAAPAVLLAAMDDRQVLRELPANFDVPGAFIGRERAAARDVGFDVGAIAAMVVASTLNDRERRRALPASARSSGRSSPEPSRRR